MTTVALPLSALRMWIDLSCRRAVIAVCLFGSEGAFAEVNHRVVGECRLRAEVGLGMELVWGYRAAHRFEELGA